MFSIRSTVLCLVALVLAAFLSACGGDGRDSISSATIPVAITAQPTSVSVVTGSNASFSVGATGDGLAYQWQRSADGALSWADIAGATTANYVIAAVDASLNGYLYRAVISGTASSATSSAVLLTVTSAVIAPSISVQPAPVSVTAGGTASFSVTAVGTSLAYQWQSSADAASWSSIAGATDATYRVSAAAPADSGTRYRVQVSNNAGTVTSDAVTLTVTVASALPTITAQPTDTSVIAGQTATFTVSASSEPAATYQWQASSDGTTYSDIVQANASSYVTPPTSPADSGKRFRVLVSNAQGTVTSDAAKLTVAAGAAVAITAQPADASVSVPSAATFTAVATGTPSPSFQWQVSTDDGRTFMNINGATAASYTTPPTVLADSGKRFRAVATNALGNAASRGALLTVINLGTGGTNPGIAVDGAGNIFVTVGPEIGLRTGPDFYGVREVTAAGAVVTLAGGVNRGYVDGPASAARFEQPTGIAVNLAGDVFVADSVNHVIRKIAGGTVSTFAGTGQPGFTNGNGRLAAFSLPKGLAIDAAGNLYVADFSNNAIRRISPTGDVTTVATLGGPPLSVGIDAGGNLYAVVNNSLDLRRISPAGVVTLLATLPAVGQSMPSGLIADPAGNVFVASGFEVYRVTPAGTVVLLDVGDPFVVSPPSLALDAVGNLYLPDQARSASAPHEIRKITPSGTVTLIP